jgi:hypothetical protein
VIQRMMRGSCFVALLLVAPVVLAQEFSADVVNTKDTGGMKRLYAGKNKVRFEVDTGNAAMGPTAVILDETQNRYIVLMSARHMYMDAPMTMVKPLITHYWRVEEVNDACPEWKKTAEQAGTYKNWGSCTKVSSEILNGRSAVKYEGVSNKGEKTHVWVDAKLRCVVKTDEGSGGFELRNIQEGSQPSSLFEVPTGFTKFDMGGARQQR